ncbi:MAG: TIGR00725 family protein [Coleofasciculaceae cyanobacterium]
MRKIVIGVMGPGNASPTEAQNAYYLGKLIAQNHWVLLTGGRNMGVMQAASRGAKAGNGLTVGILPTADAHGLADTVDLAIFTDMGSARNNINVLSCHVVIACGMGAGTASEVALAIKANKPVILLNDNQESQQFFRSLSPCVFIAQTPVEAIAIVQDLLAQIPDFSIKFS